MAPSDSTSEMGSQLAPGGGPGHGKGWGVSERECGKRQRGRSPAYLAAVGAAATISSYFGGGSL